MGVVNQSLAVACLMRDAMQCAALPPVFKRLYIPIYSLRPSSGSITNSWKLSNPCSAVTRLSILICRWSEESRHRIIQAFDMHMPSSRSIELKIWDEIGHAAAASIDEL